MARLGHQLVARRAGYGKPVRHIVQRALGDPPNTPRRLTGSSSSARIPVLLKHRAAYTGSPARIEAVLGDKMSSRHTSRLALDLGATTDSVKAC